MVTVNAPSELRIEILPPPKTLERRKLKPGFARPPQRDQAAHAAKVSSGIEQIQRAVAPLTPEQKRAIFLKLESINPLQEADLKKAGLIPIRQQGKQFTVALATDAKLTAFEECIDKYEMSVVQAGKQPTHAALVANLELAPALLAIEDRTSDSFQTERAELVGSTWANVKIELSPLRPKDDTPQSLRRALDEAFAKLKSAFGTGTQGQIFDHIYDRDFRAITLNVRVRGKFLGDMLKSLDWSFITWFDTLPRFQTFAEQLANFDLTGKKFTRRRRRHR